MGHQQRGALLPRAPAAEGAVVTVDPGIEVWLGVGGTTGECGCGWRSMTPAGVIPDAVILQAEAHAAETGHRWPTEAEATT